MNRKILFFDIDGTIMGVNRFIPESAKSALKLAKEKGHLCYVCTGRSFAMLPPEILELNFDGFICAGGTHVSVGEKEIIDFRLTSEQLERILSPVTEAKLSLFIEGKNFLYHLPFRYYENKMATRVFLKELTNKHAELNLLNLGEVSASKFSGMINPFQWNFAMNMAEKLSDFMTLIIHRIPNEKEYNEVISSDSSHRDTENILNSSGFGFLEMLPKGFNKATGIQAVLEEVGIDLNDAYGFGDSENDKEMLQFLTHSVCMGNGVESMKKIASYVTSSLNEDGLYKAMEHFSLI